MIPAWICNEKMKFFVLLHLSLSYNLQGQNDTVCYANIWFEDTHAAMTLFHWIFSKWYDKCGFVQYLTLCNGHKSYEKHNLKPFICNSAKMAQTIHDAMIICGVNNSDLYEDCTPTQRIAEDFFLWQLTYHIWVRPLLTLFRPNTITRTTKILT